MLYLAIGSFFCNNRFGLCPYHKPQASQKFNLSHLRHQNHDDQQPQLFAMLDSH